MLIRKWWQEYAHRDWIIEVLESLLKQRLAASEKQRIIFQGDEDILYKKFINIMDIIKRSGAKEINIAHEKAK